MYSECLAVATKKNSDLEIVNNRKINEDDSECIAQTVENAYLGRIRTPNEFYTQCMAALGWPGQWFVMFGPGDDFRRAVPQGAKRDHLTGSVFHLRCPDLLWPVPLDPLSRGKRPPRTRVRDVAFPGGNQGPTRRSH